MEEGAGERQEVGGSRFDSEKTGAGGSKVAGEVTWPSMSSCYTREERK